MSKPPFDDFLDRMDLGQRLSVDFGTELQLEIDGVDPRLQSEVIGLEVGKYLIVKTPTLSQLGGVSVKLFGGNRVVVRYVYRGTVYGFETTIMDSIASPFRLLFLTYPKVVSERNIRSNRRVNTLLPASLGPENDAAEGTVTDISIAGCQLEIPTERLTDSVNTSVNAECALTLQLPGVAGDFQIRGKLRNVSKDAKLTRLGIAFEDLDENVQLAIDAYVKQSV